MSIIFYYFLFLQFLIFISTFIWDNLKKTRLEKLIEEQRKLAKLHTVGIVITDAQKTLYQNIFSDDIIATIETPFVIGSVSKSFTALSFLKLENSDELISYTIDKFELGEYLDEDILKGITVGELLNHTSGLDRLNPRLTTPKGTWSYSNFGYSLLGKIVSKVSGKKYSQNLKDSIFDPLGMKNTRAEYSDKIIESYDNFLGARYKFTNLEALMNERDGFEIPAGYISSSIEDMGKYLRFYLDEKNKDILSKMTICNVEIRDNMYYGMGLITTNNSDNVMHHHNGVITSFLSDLFIIPKLDLGFFIVTNTDDNLCQAPYKQFINAVKNLLLSNAIELYDGVDGSLYFYTHFVYDFWIFIVIAIPFTYLVIIIVRKIKRKEYTWFKGIKGKIIFGVDVLLLCILPMFILIFAFGVDRYYTYVCTYTRDLFFTIISVCILLFVNLIVKIVYIILYIKFKWEEEINSNKIEQLNSGLCPNGEIAMN